MSGRILAVTLILVLLATAGAATAQEPPDLAPAELARRGTNSTALVDLFADSSALTTAFCVHPSGLFVTTAEPLYSQPTVLIESVKLVIRPGRPDQAVHDAKVVRRRRDAGLALLKVDGAVGLTALPLASPESMDELMDVATFDVPSRPSAEQSAKHLYPPIKVATGSISALSRKGGRLERIQFDATLSQGSTGGCSWTPRGASSASSSAARGRISGRASGSLSRSICSIRSSTSWT